MGIRQITAAGEGEQPPGHLHRGQRLRRHRQRHRPGDRLSAVAQLTMLMDGPEDGALYDDYCDGLQEQRGRHRQRLCGRGVGSAMRKIKHGKLAGLLRRLLPEAGGRCRSTSRGRTSWRMCPSTSTAGRSPPSSAPTGRASPPCSAASWARCPIRGASPSPRRGAGHPAGRRGGRRGDPPPHRLCAPVPQL